MPCIKLVVFDVDGVILNSLTEVIKAVNIALAKFGGRVIEFDQYKYHELKYLKDFCIYQGVPEDIDWDDFYQVLNDSSYKFRVCAERPGIRSVLRFLQEQGLPIFLASACGEKLTHEKISHHSGLLDFVDRIYGGEKKEEVFFSIFQELGLRSTEVLFITDTCRDIEEAFSAGVNNVIALLSDYSFEEKLSEYPCYVVKDNQELLALLKVLF